MSSIARASERARRRARERTRDGRACELRVGSIARVESRGVRARTTPRDARVDDVKRETTVASAD